MKHISEIIPEEIKVPCTKCKTPKELNEENFARDKRKEGIGFFTYVETAKTKSKGRNTTKEKMRLVISKG